MIKILQELKDLIPPLSTDEKAQLESNCIDEGIRDPLVLAEYPDENAEMQTVLADGHNRYVIAQDNDLPYKTVTKEFESLDAVKLWMIDNQKGRRNLSDWVKLELAQVKREILAAKGREKQATENNKWRDNSETLLSIVDKSEPEPKHNTREEIAKDLGWSTGKVAMADKVRKHIETNEDQELRDKLRKNEVSINQAYQEVKKKEKMEERQRKKEIAKSAFIDVVQKINTPKVKPGEWIKVGNHHIYCGDNTDSNFLDNLPYAAFAFADPPYNENVMEWDSEFLWNQDYLQDYADIVAVTPGISQIPVFFQNTKMQYKWSCSAWITNGMTRGALGFGNWIYIALFSKLESIHKNKQDFYQVSISNKASDLHSHRGKKPAELIVSLISDFTKKDDVVIDNFLGSGTTLFCCEEMDRICYGAEKDISFCQDIVDKFYFKYG